MAWDSVRLSGIAAGLLLAAHAMAQPVLYLDFDAARGTLPTEQCWELAGAATPAPSIVNGELVMGPTTAAQTQSFRHDLLYDFFRDNIVFEWDLKVISSGYNANSCGVGQRAGWYASVTDQSGRYVGCGVSSNRVFLTNNNASFSGTNAPVTTQDFTDAFHAFRLQVNASGAVLFVDGVQRLSMPLGNAGVVGTTQAVFGDTSVCQGSATRVHYLRISLPPQCGVDFNRDCVADFFDYLDFVDAFAALRPDADFNADGVIDFFDYLDFVDLMSRDC